MRILYHHRTLGDGAEGIHIREMISAFRALGHEVHVVALVGEEHQHAVTKKRNGWNRISRLLPGVAYEAAELGYNLVATTNVVRAIRRFRPDFVYDRYNSYSTAAVNAARRIGTPVFLEVNAPVAYERSAYQEKLPLRFPKLAVRYEEMICSRADHVFAVSTPLMEFLVNERKVAPTKISVLPNGANPDDFQPLDEDASVRKQFQLGDRRVIGFVGILRPWHGVELVITAFANLAARFDDLHLLIVGDGPHEEELKNQVRRRCLMDRVTFTGRVAHCEVRHYVAAMNIAVSPKATFYASPMKILEYMAMRIPVVAPDTPNIRDILKSGRDGLLFEADDLNALETALEELLVDSDLADQIGMAGRVKIERELNWRNNALSVLHKAGHL